MIVVLHADTSGSWRHLRCYRCQHNGPALDRRRVRSCRGIPGFAVALRAATTLLGGISCSTQFTHWCQRVEGVGCRTAAGALQRRSTREMVVHPNYVVVYRVRRDSIEFVRALHVPSEKQTVVNSAVIFETLLVKITCRIGLAPDSVNLATLGQRRPVPAQHRRDATVRNDRRLLVDPVCRSAAVYPFDSEYVPKPGFVDGYSSSPLTRLFVGLTCWHKPCSVGYVAALQKLRKGTP